MKVIVRFFWLHTLVSTDSLNVTQVKSKKGDIDLELADNATVKDLQHAFHKKSNVRKVTAQKLTQPHCKKKKKKDSKVPPERQRFSLESSVEKGICLLFKTWVQIPPRTRQAARSF